MNIKEIKAALKTANIKFDSKAKKAELEKLLPTAKPAKGEYSKAAKVKQAASMAVSMSVKDRRVFVFATKKAYKNSSEVWRHGLIGGSACNVLSKKLLAAGAAGKYPIVKIGDGEYQLAVGWEKASGKTAKMAASKL